MELQENFVKLVYNWVLSCCRIDRVWVRFSSHALFFIHSSTCKEVFSSNDLFPKWNLGLLLIIRLLRLAIFSFAECSAQHCTSSIHIEKLHAVQRFDWHTFMDALCFIWCIQENTTSFSGVPRTHKPRKKLLAVQCLEKVYYFENSCLVKWGQQGVWPHIWFSVKGRKCYKDRLIEKKMHKIAGNDFN